MVNLLVYDEVALIPFQKCRDFNPLCPESDQHEFSPHNITYIIKRKGYEI